MTTENQKLEATNPDAQSGLSSASLLAALRRGKWYAGIYYQTRKEGGAIRSVDGEYNTEQEAISAAESAIKTSGLQHMQPKPSASFSISHQDQQEIGRWLSAANDPLQASGADDTRKTK